MSDGFHLEIGLGRICGIDGNPAIFNIQPDIQFNLLYLTTKILFNKQTKNQFLKFIHITD